MKITGDITEIRAIRWAEPDHLSWGLVPTMGYFHQGHLSLVRSAREENDRVAVTIFVNPSQFAPNEDLSSYPRDLQGDLELLHAEKVDLVFTPANAMMYPPGFQTTVVVDDVSRPLEGSRRPTHFQGVTTVVAKLFNILQPQRAYFGQKDAQQTVVIRRMVRDLNFNLQIVICPTVRESDGLAMSSRNTYLNPKEREAAAVLFRALRKAEAAYRQGERDGDVLRNLMEQTINAEPLARIDYVSVADPNSLTELDHVGDNLLLSTATYIGETRLIDNIPIWS